jgi:hypothetical protein
VHVTVAVMVVAMAVIVAVVVVAVAIVGGRGRGGRYDRLGRFDQRMARRVRSVRMVVAVSVPGVVVAVSVPGVVVVVSVPGVVVVVVVRMSHAAPDLRGSVRHVVATRDGRRRKLGVFGERDVLLKPAVRALRGPERYAA